MSNDRMTGLGHLFRSALGIAVLQKDDGPMGSCLPKGPLCSHTRSFPARHRRPHRVNHRGTPFNRARRYLSSEGKVKAKGGNPRPALGHLADLRFTRGVDVVTAYPRGLRSLGPGIDVLLKERRKMTKTGTSPMMSCLLTVLF